MEKKSLWNRLVASDEPVAWPVFPRAGGGDRSRSVEFHSTPESSTRRRAMGSDAPAGLATVEKATGPTLATVEKRKFPERVVGAK